MQEKETYRTELLIDGIPLEINEFVSQIISQVNVSLIGTLRTDQSWDQFTITVSRL
ncbi:MAG: hypothetical protein K9L73_03545 [Spirochaetia bacterium]|nr:hypothetical protein [Spirochaetia bacterium]